VIENGFLYDFYKNQLHAEDSRHRKKMREIIARDAPFTKRKVVAAMRSSGCYRDKRHAASRSNAVDAIPAVPADQY